ncbi:hypothetical protein AB1I63_06745 [Streptococcus pneumoniae]
MEEELEIDKNLSFKAFWQHLLTFIKFLAGMGDIMKLLCVLAISSALLNITVPVATLFLSKHPFLGLQTGQALSIISILNIAGVILGSSLSGNLLKHVSTKLNLYIGQSMCGLILVGFFFQNFWMLLMGIAGGVFSIGVIMPRLQTAVMSLIPEDAMGSIQSAIGVVDLVLPSLLGMLFVALATSLGIVSMIFLAFPLFILSIYWLVKMKGMLV